MAQKKSGKKRAFWHIVKYKKKIFKNRASSKEKILQKILIIYGIWDFEINLYCQETLLLLRAKTAFCIDRFLRQLIDSNHSSFVPVYNFIHKQKRIPVRKKIPDLLY